MRRLLTGYAVYFNHKHDRAGHLFQNRYKSILCQEDTYLLELVRYIHLNPLRAGIVLDLNSLDRYRYSGHAAIVGIDKMIGKPPNISLIIFLKGCHQRVRQYREYIQKGVSAGKRPDLVGGGLVRSVGGWHALKELRKRKVYMKGDERILGDSDFIEAVLQSCQDEYEHKYLLKAKGYNFRCCCRSCR